MPVIGVVCTVCNICNVCDEGPRPAYWLQWLRGLLVAVKLLMKPESSPKSPFFYSLQPIRFFPSAAVLQTIHYGR